MPDFWLKVRDQWRQLEELNTKQQRAQDIVDSVLEGATEKHCIDAAQLGVKVPDLLLRQCEKEIQRVCGFAKCYHWGKNCLC